MFESIQSLYSFHTNPLSIWTSGIPTLVHALFGSYLLSSTLISSVDQNTQPPCINIHDQCPVCPFQHDRNYSATNFWSNQNETRTNERENPHRVSEIRDTWNMSLRGKCHITSIRSRRRSRSCGLSVVKARME